MPNPRTFLILALLIFPALLTVAQPPAAAPAPAPSDIPRTARTPLPLPSLKDLGESDVYYSPSETYTIALPKWRNTSQRITAEETGGVAAGAQNKWMLREANITITQFIPLVDSTEDQTESYSSLESRMKAGVVERIHGTIISSRPLLAENFRGIEIVFTMPDGTKTISRVYRSEKISFTLVAFITDADAEKLVISALDSFKILTDADRAADIARRIEKATPGDLPQSPVPSRPSSDTKDNALKGKVRSILRETEYPANSRPPGRTKSSEEFYNENGNLTRSIEFDYRHNPLRINVHGYIDGARAVKEGWVRYEYNPPPAMAPPSSSNTKPPVRDPRYSTKHVYTYDKKRRLTEEQIYDNTGEPTYRITYVYSENGTERSVQNSKGELRSRTIEKFDKKGNVTERTEIRPEYPDGTRTFKYEAFDQNGNWTKRAVTGKSGNLDGTLSDFAYIEYRTITYYP